MEGGFEGLYGLRVMTRVELDKTGGKIDGL